MASFSMSTSDINVLRRRHLAVIGSQHLLDCSGVMSNGTVSPFSFVIVAGTHATMAVHIPELALRSFFTPYSRRNPGARRTPRCTPRA